jgi:hypothetical protein
MTRKSRLWTAWLIGEDGNAPRNPAGYRLARKFWGRQVARMHWPGAWRLSKRVIRPRIRYLRHKEPLP